MLHRFKSFNFQLKVTGNGNDISKHVTMVYIKGNWFLIPLAVDVLGTEFPEYPSLVLESASTRNSYAIVQLSFYLSL